MLLAAALTGGVRAQAVVEPDPRYRDAALALTRFIEDQLAEKHIPSAAIALVDDQRVVWARGFGGAGADTPFRVASVSKLFTDVAVMQLVERGTLDLDAPLERYAPDALPRNPFGAPVTLRQLLAHRSGMVREPPVGHYFDPTSPSVAATARSLANTSLVYAPGSATKYSNAAITVAGFVIERTQGVPFAEYMRANLLAPLRIRGSFAPDRALLARRARGTMWTVDGHTFAAPTFALGIEPAAELSASMLDLGRFLSMLFAGGDAPGGRILARPTLESMWDVRSGFGLGFAVGELDGRRRIGHSGWHYGFGTELAALPAERLGVAVSLTMDAANATAERIANEALRQMLAARAGQAPPPMTLTQPVPPGVMAALEGRWRSAGRTWEFWVRGSELWGWSLGGGFPSQVRARGDTLLTDGLLRWGDRFLPAGNMLIGARDTLRRDPDPRPDTIPTRWRALVGEYGWDHDVLYIHERGGRLYALIEWFGLYPFDELDPGVGFRFPGSGLYAGEDVRFRLRGGRAEAVSIAGVEFPRRVVGPEDGSTFRVTLLKPVAQLRREALAATPPAQPAGLREPDLVDLASLDPTIRFDIRYATSNNFMSAPMYTSAQAYLQRPAAEALLRAHRRLAEAGYGLLIHDAYRPWYVTRMFWDGTAEQYHGFVANPARGSKHNRGCAVDLTLYDLATGRPVEMVSGYDEFSPRAYPFYPGGTSLQRWRRDLLRRAMQAEGFTVDAGEWWHFDYVDWARYPVMNIERPGS